MSQEGSASISESGEDRPFVQYFQDSKSTTIDQDYNIKDLLGDGGFSVVKKGIRRSDGAEVAIKIIKKRKVCPEDLEREVNIWKLASETSKRVVQLYDIYEDNKTVNLVMELMSGGELFEKIVEMEDYSERFAATIIKQVFLIIRDLHKVHIVHQDLKPENLLLISSDTNAIKLCDFGLAEIAEDDVELVGIVGSTTYMAPEVVAESGHSKPVDAYAAGVIMYILLCGYPPFEPENGIVDLEFPEPEWNDISEPAKELITRLLNKDPEQRPTPDEALRHNWFMDVETVREPKPLYGTIRTLKKFRERLGGDNANNAVVGSMRDVRGRTEGRTTVFGVFDVPQLSNATTPAAPVEQPKPVEVIKNVEAKPEKPQEKVELAKTSSNNGPKTNSSSLQATDKEKLLAALKSVDSNSKSMESLLQQAKPVKRKSTKSVKKKTEYTNTPAIEESITKFKKELQSYQESTELLRKQILGLRMELAAEAAKRDSIEKRFNWEISLIKKNVEEEKKKQKKISQILSKKTVK